MIRDWILQVLRQGVPRWARVGRRPEEPGVPQEVRALRLLREAPQLHDPLQRQGPKNIDYNRMDSGRPISRQNVLLVLRRWNLMPDMENLGPIYRVGMDFLV